LANFAKTCKRFRTLAHSFYGRAFDATRPLKKHFIPTEIVEFHARMKYADALISGSTALQLFERMDYPNSDLDVYVQEDRSNALLSWLEDRYLLTGASRWYKDPPRMHRAISKVYTFERNFNGQHSAVQLILTSDHPLEAILEFNLSCVMNFITHEHAYSLFPYSTFVRREALLMNERHHDAMYAKYYNRGFAIADLLEEDICVPRATRWVNDGQCWKI
ncbi:hypothetical protein BDN72DRAFT_732535, partial [Pluteus cervinus]